MFRLHSLTYITYGYILGNVLLYTSPPEMFLQIQIHLGVSGVYRVWRVMSFLEYQLPDLGIDFITGLPRTRSGYDSIWVIR